jgi:hypothetical protein
MVKVYMILRFIVGFYIPFIYYHRKAMLYIMCNMVTKSRDIVEEACDAATTMFAILE